MAESLQLILLEESPADAALVLDELARADYRVECRQVATLEALAGLLPQADWDLVIADYQAPRQSALGVLQFLGDQEQEIPCIVMCGTMEDGPLVEALKGGAADFIYKQRPGRLVPAVQRVLAEANQRRQRRRADRELRSLKRAVETMQIGVTITNLDGIIIYTNPADAEMHGYAVEELLGKDVRIFAPTGLWGKQPRREVPLVYSLRRESVNLHRNGALFPVQLMSDVVLDSDGAPLALVTTCENIAERKRVEERLRLQEAAMESSMDGMAILDMVATVIYVNPALAAMYQTGLPEDFQGMSWCELFPDDEVLRLDTEVLPALQQQGKWQGEVAGQRLDGSQFPLELSMTRIEGIGIVCVLRDITQRRISEEQLRYLVSHDSLTGLYNRAYFDEELSRLERGRQFPVSVVVADLDGLKEANDTRGHTIGDELLRRAAVLLRESFRAEDIVARVGGDEFAVLLPYTDELTVTEVMERLERQLASSPPEVAGVRLRLSLGAATAHSPQEVRMSYILADDRMYMVKQGRRESRIELVE